MTKKLILKDFGKNKIVNIVLLLFIVMSAFLMSTGTMVISQLTNSMNAIFEVAKPPHFLQMHAGEINQNQIDAFSKKVTYIENQETVNMLNISAANIWYEKTGKGEAETASMADNMMDNGFVIQNQSFDYLVDRNNQIAVVKDGQIGVPISYMETYKLSAGDKVIIKDGDFQKEFQIVCFVRDAQMASSMASSTRFLVSAKDQEELKENTGDMEYIVEYRFQDEKYAGEFQTRYTAKDSGMPVNGPAITYPLIKLLNGISGGLLAGLLMLVSLLLIAVAVINVKFTILSTIEEEQKEIGAMKAIGFSKKDIRNLYLYKYRVLAVAGCMMGYAIGLLVNTKITGSITQTFGECPLSAVEKAIPIISTIAVYVLVIRSCKNILKKIDRITVVEALVYGKQEKQKSKSKYMTLGKSGAGNINVIYALRECFISRKSWSIVAHVFLLATLIMLVPVNLLKTFQSPEFSASIGSAKCDIRMGIQFTDGMQAKYDAVTASLNDIKEVSGYEAYAAVHYEVMGEEGKEAFVIENGNYNPFPVTCMEGRSPQKTGEIAVSYLNAKKYKLKMGDSITVYQKDAQIKLFVCGIYQDITGGGYTAKAQLPYCEKDVMSYTFYVNLDSSITPEEFMQQYGETFHYVKIAPMKEYLTQTFGNLVTSFKSVAFITSIIAIFMAGFMIALFIKLRTIKELSKCAVLRAIGFTSKEIHHQYMLQSGICAFIGIILGIVVTNTLGEGLIGTVLSVAGVGLAKFKFITDGWFCYGLCPIVLLLIAVYVTWRCQQSVKKYQIVDFIKE